MPTHTLTVIRRADGRFLAQGFDRSPWVKNLRNALMFHPGTNMEEQVAYVKYRTKEETVEVLDIEVAVE